MGKIIKCKICDAHGRDNDHYNTPISAEELMEKHFKKSHKKEKGELNKKRKKYLLRMAAAKRALEKLDREFFQTVFNNIDTETTHGDAFYRSLGLDSKKWLDYDGNIVNITNEAEDRILKFPESAREKKD